MKSENGHHKSVSNEISHPYDDILNLPHHVSEKYEPMARSCRAAQFSPFSALTGYDAAVSETARQTSPKFRLTEDEKAELDERMQFLVERIQEKPAVTVTYFIPDTRKTGGSYKTVIGTVRRIDTHEQLLIFTDSTKIPLYDIYRLEGEFFCLPEG